MMQALLLFPLATHDVAGQFGDAGIIRESAASDLQLTERSVKIEVSTVKIFGTGEVGFAGIGTKTKGGLNRCFGLREARRSVVVPEEVEVIVGVG